MKKAVKRAELSNLDDCAGLPTSVEPYIDPAFLKLYDPEIADLDPKKKIDLAMETEKIALADPRINNSHGASFTTSEGAFILV